MQLYFQSIKRKAEIVAGIRGKKNTSENELEKFIDSVWILEHFHLLWVLTLKESLCGDGAKRKKIGKKQGQSCNH